MEEIAQFLRSYPPFDQLPAEAVAQAAGSAQIEYFAADHVILQADGPLAEFLYVIRKGRVDLQRQRTGNPEAQVVDTLGPGEAFGYPSLIRGRPPIVSVRAHTEVLAYLIPAPIFHDLRGKYPAFASFFAASAIERIDHAMRAREAAAAPALFQTRLRSLARRPLVAIAPTATVREAAQLMRDQNVSALLVDLPPFGVLDEDTGIITDRDLRNRVLAAGLPDTTPVSAVMTPTASVLTADSLVFEGLLTMLERNVHHMPIADQGQIIGMVTHSDILRHQSSSPLFLPRQLDRAHSLADLRHYTDQVAATVSSLLDSGARVSDIGRVVAVAHDALLKRLIRDAEAALGAPPAPYAWVVLGSEGRYEQTLRTDQDNAIVYADGAPPEAEPYFRAMAERIVEQLVACGFPRCPGNIMATNPEWRQPLSVWQGYFSRWIDVPDEEALLRSAIFFDFRKVYGALDVEHELRPILARARGNRVFLARMARMVLRQPAPLTFFRTITLERRGDQRNLLDLKLRGTGIIVNLARLFALEAGSTATGTVARLRQSVDKSNIGHEDAESLISAFELLSLLRLRHQQAQLAQGDEPDNYLVVPHLTPREQRELKESLQYIATVQRGVAITFQVDRLG